MMSYDKILSEIDELQEYSKNNLYDSSMFNFFISDINYINPLHNMGVLNSFSKEEYLNIYSTQNINTAQKNLGEELWGCIIPISPFALFIIGWGVKGHISVLIPIFLSVGVIILATIQYLDNKKKAVELNDKNKRDKTVVNEQALKRNNLKAKYMKWELDYVINQFDRFYELSSIEEEYKKYAMVFDDELLKNTFYNYKSKDYIKSNSAKIIAIGDEVNRKVIDLNKKFNDKIEIQIKNLEYDKIDKKITGGDLSNDLLTLAGYNEIIKGTVEKRLLKSNRLWKVIKASAVGDFTNIKFTKKYLLKYSKIDGTKKTYEKFKIKKANITRFSPSNSPILSNIDYNDLQKLGALGEKHALLFEYNRIVDEFDHSNSISVLHVSNDYGDKYGFDIYSSFDDVFERFIEVKTSFKESNDLSFYISANELEKMELYKNDYYLYICTINREDHDKFDIEILNYKFIKENIQLKPQVFKASIR